ncbi:unnamed protein product, partial [Nesidiocoris tenuis]
PNLDHTIIHDRFLLLHRGARTSKYERRSKEIAFHESKNSSMGYDSLGFKKVGQAPPPPPHHLSDNLPSPRPRRQFLSTEENSQFQRKQNYRSRYEYTAKILNKFV